jgi:ATP-dependent Clp protease adaptor protein ClpS
MSEKPQKPAGEVLERTKPVVIEPTLYKVVLHNDDYTTMEFVIEILETVFNKQPAEAFRIMMQVHTQQRGICGLYPYEVAETKTATVHEMAKSSGFPLRASIEPE